LPDFGQTSKVGAASTTEGYVTAHSAHCPEAGKAISITVNLKVATTDHKVKCALYDASLVLVDSTEERTIAAGTDGWETFNFASPPTLAHADYWITVWAEATTGTCEVYFSNAGGVSVRAQAKTYDSWPNPLAGTAYANYRVSIYCTYSFEGTTTYPVDILFKKLDISMTPTIDTAIKKPDVSSDFLIDARIGLRFSPEIYRQVTVLFKQNNLGKCFDTDFIVGLLASVKSLDVDTLFEKVGIESLTIDSIFKKLNIPITAQIDTILRSLSLTKSSLIDTLFKKLNLSKVLTLDLT